MSQHETLLERVFDIKNRTSRDLFQGPGLTMEQLAEENELLLEDIRLWSRRLC